MQALAIVGTTVGVIGGALTAAFRFKAIVGLACSLALLFAGGIAVVLSDAGSYGWNDIGAVALWLVLFAALPLVVIFVVTFAGLSVVRNRIWPTRTKSDPAP